MASAAGSTTDIEPDDHLRDWFTAYINKLEDIEEKYPNVYDQYDNRQPAIAAAPDEMSREYGDLRSVLREVGVDKVWMILMSVTGSQYYTRRWGRIRKRRDALYESTIERHVAIVETIVEYLTPDQILQFLQLQDDRGEKYLYSLMLHFASSILSVILYRLPEV